jgi:hypothetical protein
VRGEIRVADGMSGIRTYPRDVTPIQFGERFPAGLRGHQQAAVVQDAEVGVHDASSCLRAVRPA